MRKKFLQGAATLSMAAAVCIMSGLVTASAGTVEAGNVAIDYDKQQLVVTLNQKGKEVPADEVTTDDLDAVIAQYINTDGTVLLEDAKSGDTVSLAATGKTVNLSAPAPYTAAGKKINNVTITATVTDNGQQILDSSNWQLKKDVSEIKFDGSDAETLPIITVKAEITKSDGTTKTTSNERTITLAKGTAKKSSDDREVLFNVANVDKNGKLKPSAWEVYDIDGKDEVAIDLTSLNTQKDNYVQVKGDLTGNAITIFIPKTDKTVKMKMNGATGKVEMTNGTADSQKAYLEYRTQYSGWQGYGTASSDDVADLSLYQERGANLYFRLASAYEAEDGRVPAGAPDTSIKITDKASNEELQVIKMPSLPGKEIKVAVAKKANAPKATVNYKKGTVIIPKGALYRINDDTGLGEFTKTAAADKITLSSSSTEADKTAYEKLLAGGSLEVKKAGDTTKKKAESKIFLLEFPNEKETLTLAAGNDASKDVKNNKVVDPADDEKSVTASSEQVKNGRGEVTSLKLTVKNGTDYDYEVVVDKSAPTADKKGKIVKAGRDITITRIDKNGSNVYIRRCADQKKAEWATDYIPMGIVPAATEEDPGTGEVVITQADVDSIATQLLASNIELSSDASNAGKTINVGKDGGAIDLSQTSFKIKDADGKDKTIDNITMKVDVTDSTTVSLAKTSDGYGIQYGTAPTAISASNVGGLKAVITITYKKDTTTFTKTHDITFSLASK